MNTNELAELICGVTNLPERLSGSGTEFSGAELLPPEIAENWPRLSADARAFAILFAADFNNENVAGWDRYERG